MSAKHFKLNSYHDLQDVSIILCTQTLKAGEAGSLMPFKLDYDTNILFTSWIFVLFTFCISQMAWMHCLASCWPPGLSGTWYMGLSVTGLQSLSVGLPEHEFLSPLCTINKTWNWTVFHVGNRKLHIRGNVTQCLCQMRMSKMHVISVMSSDILS